MQTYGATIRQIRLSKGFTHKEIYTGILSKSFAIDFEKGLYDIKFHLMLKILDRLMISVDELLLIHSQYKITPCHEPLLNVNLERLKNDPSYSSDIEKQLFEEMQIDKTSSSRLQYAEIVVLRCVYGDPEYQICLSIKICLSIRPQRITFRNTYLMWKLGLYLNSVFSQI